MNTTPKRTRSHWGIWFWLWVAFLAVGIPITAIGHHLNQHTATPTLEVGIGFIVAAIFVFGGYPIKRMVDWWWGYVEIAMQSAPTAQDVYNDLAQHLGRKPTDQEFSTYYPIAMDQWTHRRNEAAAVAALAAAAVVSINHSAKGR
jgi:hypothetical protein